MESVLFIMYQYYLFQVINHLSFLHFYIKTYKMYIITNIEIVYNEIIQNQSIVIYKNNEIFE